MHAFKRDITSRHNKSTNKCEPVFALIAGFRRERAQGREKLEQGEKNEEEKEEKRVTNTCCLSSVSVQEQMLALGVQLSRLLG